MSSDHIPQAMPLLFFSDIITDRCSWSDWSWAIISAICAEFFHLAHVCPMFYLLSYLCKISILFPPCYQANIMLRSVQTSPGSQCQLVAIIVMDAYVGRKTVSISLCKPTGK